MNSYTFSFFIRISTNYILFLVAVTGSTYTYIVGVDRTDVLLLCDPEDNGSLSMLRWSVDGGIEFDNPVNLNSESGNLPDVLTTFYCMRDGVSIVTSQICVKGISMWYNLGSSY